MSGKDSGKKEGGRKPGVSLDYVVLGVVALAFLLAGLGIGSILFKSPSPSPTPSSPAQEPVTLSREEISEMVKDWYAQMGAQDINVLSVGINEEDGVKKVDYTVEFKVENTYYKVRGTMYLKGDILTPIYLDKNGVKPYKREEILEMKEIPQQVPKSDKPEVKLYIMSFCPYGNIAEQAMEPAIKLLGDKMDFEPVYIYYGKNWCDRIQSEGKEVNGEEYCSMHDKSGNLFETEQDIREKCIYQLYGAEKWAEYVKAVDSNCSPRDINTCWRIEGLDINYDAVQECSDANWEDIMARDIELTTENGVSGSPTLIINGVIYRGERTPQAYLDAICEAFTNPPEECNQQITGEQPSAPQGSCG